MTIAATPVPLSEAKTHLSELARRVRTQHERITLTRNGEPEAVLLSVDDLEGLELTLEVLGDTEAVREIAEASRRCSRANRGSTSRRSVPTSPVAVPRAVDGPPYEVRFQPAARKAIAQRLPEAVAAAVVEFCAGPLVEEPHRVGKRLFGPLAHCHGARRGSYRVVYQIDDESLVVEVLQVVHRADVHRYVDPAGKHRLT